MILDVIGGLIISSDNNPFDFHAEMPSLLPIFEKYLWAG